MLKPEEPQDFKLRDWLVEPSRNRIRRGNEIRMIEPRLMAVLVHLANHHGEVLTQKALTQAVWEVNVSDTIVRRSISALRKAFDDNHREPLFIKTISKQGYTLLPKPLYLAGQLAPGETLMMANLKSGKPKRLPLKVMLLIAFLMVCLLMFFIIQSTQSQVNPTFTTQKGIESQATFVNEGRGVVFIASETESQRQKLTYKALEGHTRLSARTAPDEQILSSCWLPQSGEVAYVSTLEGIDRIGLWALNPEQPRLLYESASRLAGLAWDEQGQRLIIAEQDGNGPFRLRGLDLSGTTSPYLSFPPPGYLGDISPTVSPRGNRIAFIRQIEPKLQDIFVLDPTTGLEQRYTHLETELVGVTWYDPETLVFSVLEEGRYLLKQVQKTTGTKAFLNLSGNARFPAFHHPWMIFEKGTIHTEITRMLLKNGALPQPLKASGSFDATPTISPDGSSLLFTSTQTGSPEIWYMQMNGSGLTRLTSFGGAVTGYPAWKHDNLTFAFESQNSGLSKIYRLNVSGGRPQQLSQGQSDQRLPCWSPDGQSLFFSSNQKDGWQIWSMSADGTHVRQVTQHGGFRSLAHKGYLYYTKHRTAGLWRRALEDGREEKLFELAQMHWADWAVSDRGIYHFRRSSKGHNLSLFQINEKQIIRLNPIPEKDLVPGLSVASDDRFLLFTRKVSDQWDLVLMDLAKEGMLP